MVSARGPAGIEFHVPVSARNFVAIWSDDELTVAGT